MTRLLTASLLALAMLVAAAPAGAQQDQRAAMFGGYSFMRTEQTAAANGDVHGALLDYPYFGTPRIGFKVSAGAHWGDVDAATNVFNASEFAARHITALIGPHFVLWRGVTSEAGLDLLAGASWRRYETAVSSIQVADDVSVAGAVQLNIDFRLSERVWLRAAQPSVLWTRFGQETQINYRIAVGLVLKAGEILR